MSSTQDKKMAKKSMFWLSAAIAMFVIAWVLQYAGGS
jgi:uncharacterized membrane protein YGL010W